MLSVSCPSDFTSGDKALVANGYEAWWPAETLYTRDRSFPLH